MEEWKTAPLAQCLQPIGTPKKIPRKQFEDSGRFPIVSQERDFINGYWSDEADVVHVESPLVVFGDHTQTLKYIDFNFVVGADGVKLLQPKPFLDPKYFYYFLMGNPVKSLGYARHFRLLKELEIVFPEPLREQERIVAILDEAFAAIATATANAEKNLANARELFESQLDRAFTGDASSERWSVKPLEDLCKIARGGSPRPIKAFITNEPDGINWIKIGDATASTKYIYETKQKIKPEGVHRSRMVHDGDFLLSNSMSFGRPYIMKTSGCIHDGWLVLSDKSGLFTQDYLYLFLGSNAAYRQFDSRASGSTVRNLNIELVRSVEIPLPSLPEQERIVAILDEASANSAALFRIGEQKLAHLADLKQSLLHKAFTGELTADSKAVDRSISEVI